MRYCLKNKLRPMRVLLLGLALGLLCLSCSDEDPAQVDSPKTIFVRSDGAGDAPTIQEALQAASDGDVIELSDGEFSGEGNRDIDFLGKRVTLRSRSGNADNCVIRLPSLCIIGCRAFDFQSGENSQTVVEGIKIVDGSGRPHPEANSLPRVESESMVVKHGGAIMCRRGASPVFRDCIFVSNDASGGGVALCIEGASLTFVGCTFYDNGSDTALFAGVDASFNFERSLIVFNRAEVLADGPQVTLSATLSCSDIYGNLTDWVRGIAPLVGVDGNLSKDPLFVDAGSGNLWLSANSPCLPDSSACGLVGTLGKE